MICSVVDVINGLNKFALIFEFVVGIIIPLLFGFALILIAVYTKTLDILFKKRGVKVKAKVEEVKRIKNVKHVKFSFEYKGKTVTKILQTTHKYEVGDVKNAVFLPTSKLNPLKVGKSDGFFLVKGGELVILFFGLILLALPFITNSIMSTKILLIGFFIFFVILAVIIIPLLRDESNITIANEEIGEVGENIINSNLVRYKPSGTKDQFDIVSTIFLVGGSILLALGFVGLLLIFRFKASSNTVIGRIGSIYTYEENGTEKIGAIYNYKANNEEYELDSKTGINKHICKIYCPYEKGDEVKILYQIKNPKKAVAVIDQYTVVVPFLIGTIFTYIGIYNMGKNKRTYSKELVKMEGE